MVLSLEISMTASLDRDIWLQLFALEFEARASGTRAQGAGWEQCWWNQLVESAGEPHMLCHFGAEREPF